MIKILRAVAAAMLLATGAHGATVDGPTLTGPVGGIQSGAYNSFFFQTGPLDSLPSGYNQALSASEALMYVNDTYVSASYAFGVDASTISFKFNWLAPTEPLNPLSFSFVLKRYKNAFPQAPFNGQDEGVITGLGFPQGAIPVFVSSTFGPFTQNQSTGAFRLAGAAEPEVTPVPIGGTLPLMLSALGIGALVMRHRAKQAAVA
ncbi:hypothetical protein C0V75_04940 [Tabrizicola sp. TH137]|nr:hypothetical protein C0V75_04940 [Tabrizicola sp. TH137]